MQLELFHTPAESPKQTRIWESLSQKQRETVIAILARLMKETIYPEPERRKNEQ